MGLCFRKAVPNQVRSFLSASSPSQALRASSPKGGAFSRRQTFRYIQNLSLWERWHRVSDDGEGKPADGGAGPRFRSCFRWGCASDGAALPLGQDPQKNRPASVSSGRLGTPAGDAAQRVHQYLAGLLDRYFLTIKATLKTIASSNSRRSRPVSFLIFSRRYTSVLRWTNRPRLVSETFRLFSKKR